MTENASPTLRLRDLFTPANDAERAAVRGVRPFFMIVAALVIGVTGYAIIFGQHPPPPILAALAVVIALIHAALHWNAALIAQRPTLHYPYLIIQSVLAFVLALLLRDTTAVLILFPSLMGESFGFVDGILPRIVMLIMLVGLAATSFVYISGWALIPDWGSSVLLIMAFVLLYSSLFGRQVEARQRIQSLLDELQIAHRQLGEYAVQVEELTRSAERERIARDLHDTLSQGLAGLILQLEAAMSHLEEAQPERTFAILEQAQTRARQALAEARATIDTLRRGEPASGDLRAMIQTEANRFSDIAAIPCTLDIRSLDRLPTTQHVHILRVVTESLSNITRHAKATSVTISAHCTDDAFVLAIADDGVGFDHQAESIPTGHYGLIGMRERIRLIGGTFGIESAEGRGTTINVRVPLPARPAETEMNDE